MAGSKIVSSKTLDQTQNGDEWHTLADALHVFSTERYNGKATRQVALESMDGSVPRRVTPPPR